MLPFCDTRVRTHCCLLPQLRLSRSLLHAPSMPRLILPCRTATSLGALLPLGLPATSRLWMDLLQGGGRHRRLAPAVLLCSLVMLPCPAFWAPAHGASPRDGARCASGGPVAAAVPTPAVARRGVAPQGPRAAQPASSLDTQRPPGPGPRSCAAPPGLVGPTSTRTPAAPAAAACRPRRRWRLARGGCPRRPRVALSAARWHPRCHRLLSAMRSPAPMPEPLPVPPALPLLGVKRRAGGGGVGGGAIVMRFKAPGPGVDFPFVPPTEFLYVAPPGE